jgi:pimeloyl-ACP methyl ester carboxylesterase
MTMKLTHEPEGRFPAPDGTALAYRSLGSGDPLVCLPGGPMLDAAYLDDLGGLSARHALVLLDPRGTGGSAVPTDPASYRCDRQVADVEALRRHLGRDRLDLLAHSGGGALAVLHAQRHPDRVGRLVLVAPSARVVGLEVTDADRREVAELRRGEPWFAAAFAAFERIWAGAPTPADWAAITPFTHGRWDADRRARAEWEDGRRNDDAAAAYFADGALDPPVTRAAIARLAAPVLVVSGEHDVALPPERAAEYAGLFARGEHVLLPGCGHSPWLDDPAALVAAVAGFTARSAPSG